MSGLCRETRLQIMLDDAELAAIDDYRFQNRMPSRAPAVRQLLRLGMVSLFPLYSPVALPFYSLKLWLHRARVSGRIRGRCRHSSAR